MARTLKPQRQKNKTSATKTRGRQGRGSRVYGQSGSERGRRRTKRDLSSASKNQLCLGLVVGRRGPVYSVRWLEAPESSTPESSTPESSTPDPIRDLSIGDRIDCIARGGGKAAVVGDQVYFQWEVSDLAIGLIIQLGDRTNALIRADALGRRPQTVAANLDRVWIVCAIEPPPKSGLIDRYIVAAHSQGIEVGILFNKVDLFMDEDHIEEIQSLLAPYKLLKIPIFYLSAETNEGVNLFRQHIRGERSVFVGHSGVGKTSLLNTLIPDLNQTVTQLSEATGKGQHTTTSSTLYSIDGDVEIIDSPGIRAFGLWGVSSQELKDHFVEFLPFKTSCQFHNCLHIMEPVCAVIDAVESEVIHFERYDAYLRIYDSLVEEEGGRG